jgi:hypothetical protein
MYGIINGIARTETTITETTMKSFGLSETRLLMIRSGIPTEDIYFLAIFVLICLSPDSFYPILVYHSLICTNKIYLE